MVNEKNSVLKETFEQALKNHQNNNLREAQNYYHKTLVIDPNHLFALNNLAVIYKTQGELQKAEDILKKAIDINPEYIDAHYNLGAVFSEQEAFQKAKSCYEKVIEINPNHITAFNNLGVVFSELKDYEKAKSCYEKTIKLNANHFGALNNLGVIYKTQGELQKAEGSFKKAIKLNPNYVDAYYNLAGVFYELNEPQKEKSCYEKILQIEPDNISAINALSTLIGFTKINYNSENEKNDFKKLIISLFKKGNIKTNLFFNNSKRILFSNDIQNQLNEIIDSDTLLKNEIIQNLLKEELFHLLLQKTSLPDIFFEKLLTKLRYEIILDLENSKIDNLREYNNFIISLAEHCWLNEYIFFKSKKEIAIVKKLKNKIENEKKIDELQISILSCYISLDNSKNIVNKLLNYKSSNLLFNDLISMQIKEPLIENELVQSIKSLNEVIDPVSKKVKYQYEENPYPRWRCTNKILSKNFFFWLNQDIEPNKFIFSDKLNNPNVLIAGCGTGKHSISTQRYKNANVLAIDLSSKSLGYAKRKTQELNIKNIEYMQADILELEKLNRKFDIIESAGTLHHMEDPIKGLKILLNILEPHGFLRLGLYSELARKHIVKMREFIKNKNYNNTSEDIKNYRQKIINEKDNPLNQKVIINSDFYSTSGVRDLLFHVQEHRFTIPQISKILKDQNLEFLGFIFPNPFIQKKFSKLFPKDKKNISLNNWNQFEIDNPDTFSNMYQFWVKKI